MKLVITDIADFSFNISGEYVIINPRERKVVPCTGCFSCWFRTPGECLINDGCGNPSSILGKCDELIIISECFYGSVSPFVKNVLDRSLSYVAPDFDIEDGRMKHKRRYPNTLELSAYFYGDNITEKEKHTAEKIMRANMENFRAKVKSVSFYGNTEEMAGVDF